MEKINCKEIWSSLVEDSKRGNKNEIVKRRVQANSNCAVYFGINISNKVKFIWSEVTNHSLIKVKALPTFKGFILEKKIYRYEKDTNYTILLQAASVEYNDIFTYLIDDIIGSIKDDTSEENVIILILSKVTKWQTFLDKNGHKSLSRNQRIGLFGELYILKNLIIPKVALSKAIDGWTGPDKSFHDFQFQKSSIEVKATSAKKPYKICVSSEKQLDDSNIDRLYLAFIALDVLKNKGVTLNDLIDSIKQLIRQEDNYLLGEFEKKLFDIGYTAYHKDEYESEKYNIREVYYYVVNEKFPRLISSSLPKGIGDLNYSVTMDCCLNQKVDVEEVVHCIRGV